MTGYEAYCLYLAVKAHFTRADYDGFKYQWKIRRPKIATYEERNDKFFFAKLARHPDPLWLLFANFSKSPKMWIRELAYGEEANAVYDEFMSKRQNTTYLFKQELKNVSESYGDLETMLNVDGGHPPLLKAYLRGKASAMLLIILNELVGFVKDWDAEMKDDPIWAEAKMALQKTAPSIEFSLEKVKGAALEVFEHA